MAGLAPLKVASDFDEYRAGLDIISFMKELQARSFDWNCYTVTDGSKIDVSKSTWIELLQEVSSVAATMHAYLTNELDRKIKIERAARGVHILTEMGQNLLGHLHGLSY